MLFLMSLFFSNATATTEIYTLSLHDALPIYWNVRMRIVSRDKSILAEFRLIEEQTFPVRCDLKLFPDRKSTRLNSSHSQISYAVFCLKKKKIYTRRHSDILHRAANFRQCHQI